MYIVFLTITNKSHTGFLYFKDSPGFPLVTIFVSTYFSVIVFVQDMLSIAKAQTPVSKNTYYIVITAPIHVCSDNHEVGFVSLNIVR